MSDQDKNLPASARKLQKAREDGQIARSRDFGHLAAIAAGGGVIVAAAALAAGWIAAATRCTQATASRWERRSRLLADHPRLCEVLSGGGFTVDQIDEGGKVTP